MPKKAFNGTIFKRCDAATTATLLEIEQTQGVHPQELASRLIAAACQYYRAKRKISFPICLVSQSEMADLASRAHEALQGFAAEERPDATPPQPPPNPPGSPPIEYPKRGTARKRGRARDKG